ncbi:hypothetical protein QYY77_21230 [Xanthomonas campestris pv. campestris]|uniref:hypothetical protein n=1 Tax=Xanthomonas campestris TaxID=339 RepID=UPI002AD3445E|nr:hypothetical protein [Xanthomonas campestris]MEA0738552.1 hypothetical protein [Xanthomonas campestris pv. campestris]
MQALLRSVICASCAGARIGCGVALCISDGGVRQGESNAVQRAGGSERAKIQLAHAQGIGLQLELGDREQMLDRVPRLTRAARNQETSATAMQADAPVLGIAPRTPIERPSPVASLHRESLCVISRPMYLATARVRGNVGMKDRPAKVRNQRLRAACSPSRGIGQRSPQRLNVLHRYRHARGRCCTVTTP